MAMLAEPRRKQKVINLRAKNNAWSNDNTKFGQRMLEKMGWTSGKGLGANENGITEHVVARFKNDDKGLGFEDKNDQWTKHEDDFNSLLANLSNANDSTENLHSGISLEDKSKKSRARIHYHKFTRGKDISRYSEKDLANIFGKKSFKNTEVTQKPLKEDIKTTEQIFTEKGSMEDYFKNKLAEFKTKNKFKTSAIDENDTEYNELGYGFCGFSQDIDNIEISNGLGYNQENKTVNDKTNSISSESGNLRNKNKKSKTTGNIYMYQNVNEHSSNTTNEQLCTRQTEKCIEEKIKKKRLKNKSQRVDNEEEICQTQEPVEEKIKKKKSKNGKTESLNYSNSNDICILNPNNTDKIVKKKKKQKNIINEASQCTPNESELDELQLNQNKKKKSSKNKEFYEDNSVEHEIVKKKKSKRKYDQNVEINTQGNTIIEHLRKKKKKKLKKTNE